MNIIEDTNENTDLDVKPYEAQVGGHSYESGNKTIGMLSIKSGYILKPIIKPKIGQNEVAFYSDIKAAKDSIAKELATFIPEYFGTTYHCIDQVQVKYLVLQDATYGFRQPCVMDIKIGRQTWDPLATEEKQRSESAKYTASRRDLGICIPGSQFFDIATGEMKRFDKNFGKSLDGTGTCNAIGSFLNGHLCFHRGLILQFLAKLWQILRWFRRQTRYHFYSSSILLIYDAAMLKEHLSLSKRKLNGVHRPTIGRQLSLRESKGPLTPGFDPARRSVTSSSSSSSSSSLPYSSSSAPASPLDDWHVMFDHVCKTHSLENNYEKDLKTMRENYSVVLTDLLEADTLKCDWVRVKMIDFAHVFPSNSIDRNYLVGLENLVRIFEEFLLDAN